MKNKLIKVFSIKIFPMLLIIIFVTIIALLLISCQKKKSELPKPAALSAEEAQNFISIKSPERVTHNTFTMVKPQQWSEVQYASNILVYLPPGSNINDSMAEKYSMMVVFLPENNTLSLRELTDEDLAKTKEIMPALDIIGDYENARFGQLDGLRIRFSIRVQNKTLESTQLRTMQGNRFYAFSQQCLQGECKYTDIFNEMAASFEWKNP
jgi:hypothetical protein